MNIFDIVPETTFLKTNQITPGSSIKISHFQESFKEEIEKFLTLNISHNIFNGKVELNLSKINKSSKYSIFNSQITDSYIAIPSGLFNISNSELTMLSIDGISQDLQVINSIFKKSTTDFSNISVSIGAEAGHLPKKIINMNFYENIENEEFLKNKLYGKSSMETTNSKNSVDIECHSLVMRNSNITDLKIMNKNAKFQIENSKLDKYAHRQVFSIDSIVNIWASHINNCFYVDNFKLTNEFLKKSTNDKISNINMSNITAESSIFHSTTPRMTFSHYAKIESSVLDGTCVNGAAEVIHSYAGPNIGLHHQSLFIATIWPDGRGNVGHGAQIGSNHTGRLADQLCVVGQGIFFGLGCKVKFPVNLSHSEYSIIATSVVLHSGNYDAPFSLFLDNGRVIPAWVLFGNLFSLLRSDLKIKQAGNNSMLESSIFCSKSINTSIINFIDRVFFSQNKILTEGEKTNLLFSKDTNTWVKIVDLYKAFVVYFSWLKLSLQIISNLGKTDSLLKTTIDKMADYMDKNAEKFDHKFIKLSKLFDEHSSVLDLVEDSRGRDYLRLNEVLSNSEFNPTIGVDLPNFLKNDPIVKILRVKGDALVGKFEWNVWDSSL